jgi:ribosomal-protein-alanine N-acetyltransferase
MLLEVRSDNAPALALYERFGFMRISQRPKYYPDGGDALILRASLGVGDGPLP